LNPAATAEYILDGKEHNEDPAKKSFGSTEAAASTRPGFKVPKFAALILFLFPIACWSVLLLCLGIDKASDSYIERSFSVMDLINSSFVQDLNQSRAILETVLNSMGVLFGLLITVIGIILQLSSMRFLIKGENANELFPLWRCLNQIFLFFFALQVHGTGHQSLFPRYDHPTFIGLYRSV
jgi:hypothetical protein